jgi:hypothetical protein
MHRPLHPREGNPVPVEYDDELAPRPVWTIWRGEKSHASTGIRTLDRLRFPAPIIIIIIIAITEIITIINNSHHSKTNHEIYSAPVPITTVPRAVNLLKPSGNFTYDQV